MDNTIEVPNLILENSSSRGVERVPAFSTEPEIVGFDHLSGVTPERGVHHYQILPPLLHLQNQGLYYELFIVNDSIRYPSGYNLITVVEQADPENVVAFLDGVVNLGGHYDPEDAHMLKSFGANNVRLPRTFDHLPYVTCQVPYPHVRSGKYNPTHDRFLVKKRDVDPAAIKEIYLMLVDDDRYLARIIHGATHRVGVLDYIRLPGHRIRNAA